MPETSTPLPLARIEHRLAGRLRLRVPSRRGDAGFFATVVEKLGQLGAVRALKTDPRTGSILIAHDGEAETLTAFAKEHGLFALEPPRAARPEPISGARRLGTPTHPLAIAATGLAGLGVYQAARGRFLGSATENFWNAYGAYAVLGRPRVAVALAAFGLYQLVRGQVFGSAASLMFYAIIARQMAGEARHRG